MVLSLGLLVDDSIVVTENIARRIREGEDRVSAAINGTGQIAMAVMGCTACLMLAFLPLLALPGGSGGYIKSLPVTVLCTVAASFVVSLTIIPFLASRLLRAHENPEGNALLRAVNGVIHGLYRPVLHASLARPAIALVLIFGLCLTAFPMLKAIGSSLFPPAETPQFLVQVKLPDGSSLARTDEALRFTESRMAKEKDIIWRASNLGRGNPQIYYSLSQREVDPTYAEVYASLKTWVPGRSDALLDRLRRDLASYPGAKIKVVEFMNGPPINAPIEVRLTGENLDVLKALAAHADAILRATPGTRDVDYAMRMDRTDLNLGVDEGKAAVLGVSAGAPRRMARMALSGEDAARYRESDGDDYPVRVRLPMAERNDLAALNQIYVPTADGAAPLSAIATPTLQSSPASISRYNRERFVVVSAYVQSGQLTSAVTSDAFARLKRDLPMPPGYRIALGGQAEAQSEGFAGMGAAVLTAILGILAVLVLEFGRLRIAAVVAAIIPLGMFGAVAALWLTGNSLSFTAAIGIVALIGIEIKNSILLVDFAEGLQREGMGLREAIEKAGEIRFLPVLLTSATAILGLMPLALEHSGLYSPLSIAIIGGLVSSTVLSRVATPVTYLLLAGRRNAKAEAASTTAVSGASA
jgi:multidrug efflux pump subunit AcrB